ncbi:MAG: ABC transporter substrate-binding protein [Deltaproteobacteria bacterium]|nr:ABC transporter substrate-binding protein [Deltaproteobacteria bacterium]
MELEFRWQKSGFISLTTLFFLSIFNTLATGQVVRSGYTSKTLGFFPMFVAQKHGFYEREGLKVQLIQMGGSAVHQRALIAGEIHFAHINPDGVILYNEKGGNLKVIAGVDNAAPYVLVGGKAYKTVADLKGSKLGATSLVGGVATFIIEYLKAKGLQYPRDYSIVVMPGGTPARVAALEAGVIAAVPLTIPDSDIAVDRGFHRLGDIVEVLPKYQFTCVIVDSVWAERNRSAVVKFLKAHIRSLTWIHDHPAEAADYYAREMRMKDPYARKGIDYYTKNGVFPRDGSPSLEGLRVNIEVQAKLGFLTTQPLPSPEKYVDLSYLREAQRELGM